MNHTVETHRGVYLYVLEGGPIRLNGHWIVHPGAARVIEEPGVKIQAGLDTELLLIDVLLFVTNPNRCYECREEREYLPVMNSRTHSGIEIGDHGAEICSKGEVYRWDDR